MNLNNVKVAMATVVDLSVKVDVSSKVLFKESLVALKSFSNLKEGVTALNKLADEIQADKNYLNRVKKIVNSAKIAVDTKLFVNVDKLNWYNVDRALKLMEHLSEHYTTDVSKIKNKLNKLRVKDSECVTVEQRRGYNEAYATTLAELYKEYKLEDTDEQKQVKIENIFGAMSAEAQAKLLAKFVGMAKNTSVAEKVA